MFIPAKRAWLLLPSGRRFDLLNPTPVDFEIEDLCDGGASTLRWGGASSVWEHSMTVAQHSLLTLAIQRMTATTGLAVQVQLANLLHDAAEMILRWDPISPLKPILGEGFKHLEDDIQRVIHLRFGLPAVLPLDWKKAIKLADRRAAASEGVHIAGWSRTDLRDGLKILLAPLEEDPLARRYGGLPWEPWPKKVAAERFEDELEHLLHQAQAA